MIEVRRVGAALDHLNLYLGDDAGPEHAELVAHGLDLLLERPRDPDLHHLSQFGLRRLIDYLGRSGLDEGRLARLEWAYLPAFEFEPTPPTLSRHLATEPDFFVDVACRVYRLGDDNEEKGEEPEAAAEEEEEEEEDEGETEPSTQERAIATNAYRLLSEWRTLPGRDGESVDYETLQAWVDRARERLREESSSRSATCTIGHLLAASPPDADGAWPCQAVRDVLERVQSPWIERGMETEMFNSMGATSRGMLDGGTRSAAAPRSTASRRSGSTTVGRGRQPCCTPPPSGSSQRRGAMTTRRSGGGRGSTGE